jgi:hypothetical protein
MCLRLQFLLRFELEYRNTSIIAIYNFIPKLQLLLSKFELSRTRNDFKGFENEVVRVINDITKFGFDLGLKEIEKGDVQDLPQSLNKELDDEDLINLERERAYDAEIDDDDEQIDVVPRNLPQRNGRNV